MKQYLLTVFAEFILIFRGEMTQAGLEFRWRAAVSRDEKSRDEYDKLAAIYKEIALHSFTNKQSIASRETPSRIDSKSVRWHGMDIYTEPYNRPIPTNSAGQSWWLLVVEPVDTHSVGHVIVARLSECPSSLTRPATPPTFNRLCKYRTRVSITALLWKRKTISRRCRKFRFPQILIFSFILTQTPWARCRAARRGVRSRGGCR